MFFINYKVVDHVKLHNFGINLNSFEKVMIFYTTILETTIRMTTYYVLIFRDGQLGCLPLLIVINRGRHLLVN
jgi:hypothetical protein